ALPRLRVGRIDRLLQFEVHLGSRRNGDGLRRGREKGKGDEKNESKRERPGFHARLLICEASIFPLRMLAAIALFAAAAAFREVHSLDDVLQSFDKQSQVRVVNVWATWCVPCVAEIAEVQSMADHYRGTNVEVIGVSLDDAIPGDRVAT